VCDTAVEKHVVPNQLVYCRVTDYFAGGCGPRLVRKAHYVRADDIDVRVSLQEIDLSLDPLCYTDVVRVHPCDEICLHVESHLHASVQCFGYSPIPGKCEHSDFAWMHLLLALKELDRVHFRRAVVDYDQSDGTFVSLVQDDALNSFFEVVWARVEDRHHYAHIGLGCVLLSEAVFGVLRSLARDKITNMNSRENLFPVVSKIYDVAIFKKLVHVR
jgi:hypothetical protein